ncbi:hypothetical protein, partial [Cloacibacillus sp.]
NLGRSTPAGGSPFKIGVYTRHLRHNFGLWYPAAGAPACCGNMDNLKMSPPCGGDIALQSPYKDTAPVPEPKVI